MTGPWEGSTRRQRLPRDWPAIRRRILARDGWRCTWHDEGGRCTAPAGQVDHVHPGDNHDDANLAALCDMHHRAKSAREGNAARNVHRLARPNEPHPGSL